MVRAGAAPLVFAVVPATPDLIGGRPGTHTPQPIDGSRRMGPRFRGDDSRIRLLPPQRFEPVGPGRERRLHGIHEHVVGRHPRPHSIPRMLLGVFVGVVVDLTQHAVDLRPGALALLVVIIRARLLLRYARKRVGPRAVGGGARRGGGIGSLEADREALAFVGAADEAGAGALHRRELGACLPAGATRGSRPPPPAARARTVARPGVARLPIVPGGVFVDRALADAAKPRDL